MSRSSRANHYGTLAERKAADRYGLDLARSSWCDAERSDGTPVEIKSTMRRHTDGQPGTFKLYEEYHRTLRRRDGYYCFVLYRVRGRGIEVLDTKMVHSSRLPRLSWHGGGSHRGTEQAKLAIADVF